MLMKNVAISVSQREEFNKEIALILKTTKTNIENFKYSY